MVKLFWPIYDAASGVIKDFDHFPGRGILAKSIRCLKELENENDTKNPIFPGSQIFWQSFIDSKEVIFIDRFFSLKTLEKMFHEFERNKDGSCPEQVFILCSKNEYREVSREVKTRKKYTDIAVKCLPERDSAYYIHDRFAIMDKKVWHFGSSIGGAEPHINAFSGPWEDFENEFRDYAMYLVEKVK